MLLADNVFDFDLFFFGGGHTESHHVMAVHLWFWALFGYRTLHHMFHTTQTSYILSSRISHYIPWAIHEITHFHTSFPHFLQLHTTWRAPIQNSQQFIIPSSHHLPLEQGAWKANTAATKGFRLLTSICWPSSSRLVKSVLALASGLTTTPWPTGCWVSRARFEWMYVHEWWWSLLGFDGNNLRFTDFRSDF